METLIMIAQLMLGLSLLVFVHEFGHFAAAKFFGMRVPKFYIFFDAWHKKIWSKKIGDTEYGIGWLPLGGYVQITGMIDETQDASQLSEVPEPWEFRAKPAWQRFIVMIAGIVMNIITGILIFAMYLSNYEQNYLPISEINKEGVYAYEAAQDIGIKTGDKIVAINGKTPERFKEVRSTSVFLGGTITVDRDGKKIDITTPEGFYKRMREPFLSPMREEISVFAVPEGRYAAEAGMKKGDKILAVNNGKITRFVQLQDSLQANKNGSVNLLIERDGGVVQLTSKVDTAGLLGFQPDLKYPYPKTEYNLGSSFKYGIIEGYDLVVAQAISIGMIFTGELDPTESVASPIKIAQIYGGTWEWGHFWRLTGLLSFVLAFMNFLPIPALDGGHMVFLTYEIITGHRPSDAFLEKAQIVGFVLIMGLMIFAFGNDIYQTWLK